MLAAVVVTASQIDSIIAGIAELSGAGGLGHAGRSKVPAIGRIHDRVISEPDEVGSD
ncbi:hypothetical protein GCM10007989_09940 [Devosia pacifica]|uniref:Uncharacterized protein n=1 Tax=Devosia pacifica TaxID=1335967 RepID=A0A918RY05_9HYPH|nr:hypothetical protein GCM10007989_09940 [Devosia pacifica]